MFSNIFNILNYLCLSLSISGKCVNGNPCDQLCYDLHDGMYECDCTEGYDLQTNGYSCQGMIY